MTSRLDMLEASALQCRSIVLLQFDAIGGGLSSTVALQNSLPPALLSFGRNKHAKFVNSCGNLLVRSLWTASFVRHRRRVSEVAVSTGQAAGSGATVKGISNSVTALPMETSDDDGSGLCTACMSSPLSVNGSCTMALTLSPPQKENSPINFERVQMCDSTSLSQRISKSKTLAEPKTKDALPSIQGLDAERDEGRRSKKPSYSVERMHVNNKSLILQESSEHIDEGMTSECGKHTEVANRIERENRRRERISRRNKGKVPWNKGRAHTEETKQRIRERTVQAMKDPKLRERLRAYATSVTLSLETRSKIKNSILKFWEAKKRIRQIQDTCVLEWKEYVAEAARKGYDGDIEYQWETLKAELLPPCKHQQRERVKPNVVRSPNHKTKIAAVKAKWADPDYCGRVLNAKENKCGSQSLRRRRSPPVNRMRISKTKEKSQSQPKDRILEEITNDDMQVSKNQLNTEVTSKEKTAKVDKNSAVELPVFKDPLSEQKLEKLKTIRANRLFTEDRKRKELTERARILMVEAKIAARALEEAAVKDKDALPSLLETRRLLEEATRSFEAVGLTI